MTISEPTYEGKLRYVIEITWSNGSTSFIEVKTKDEGVDFKRNLEDEIKGVTNG
ncbi:MAG: hypothetical protein GY804_01145 [Alphaproteobacteria bacterium]|nr:hypothetical protein [Alphaproteobacteria bacterium]